MNYLTMLPFAIYVSKIIRAIPVLVRQLFLVFILFPVAFASGASEQSLQQDKLIPDSLIRLGSEDGRACAILVEKDSQTLMVYEYKDTFSLKYRFRCSTGEITGKKEKSGDRKTPEGVYFLTKAFKKRYLSPTYGNGAFVMDYPNFLDRKFSRSGYNIWLHGSNKSIKSRDSNGCVVTNNNDLTTLARCIDLNRTPIIIRQKLNMVRAESQLSAQKSLMSFLDDWKTSFITGDRDKYMACYYEPSEDLDTIWETWDRIRANWQHDQAPVGMRFQDLTLIRDNPCVVALFDQVIQLDAHERIVGKKKLFLENNGKTWKIVGEVYQSGDQDDGARGPLVAALKRLDRLHSDQRAIADLVAKWVAAWSSKDIRRYGACYAPDFQSGVRNLRNWIRYKERLNRRYGTIQVSIKDLEIELGKKRSTVKFLQLYRSSGHQSVGIKHLRLKRIGGTWKIYRETYNRITG